jgi:tetratricopeptide (TPR) repeat protein
MCSAPDRSSVTGRRSRVAAVARAATLTDVVIGLAVAVLLGFAPAAWVATERQPRPPDPVVELSIGEPTPYGKVVKELPAGIPPDVTAQTPESLRKLATAALGARGAARLLRLLQPVRFSETLDKNLVWMMVGNGGEFPYPYPYRYPAMTRILDRAPTAGFRRNGAALGAALVLLSSRRDAEALPKYVNAAPAAFAVLHRASLARNCDARLNLLLMVASEHLPQDKVVRAEAERAMDACPNDPTPGWVLGQFQSLRAQQIDLPDTPVSAPNAAAEQASATFETLVEQFPDSPDALAGAADAHVRVGERIAAQQPFSARHEFRLAVQLYERASKPSGSAEIEAGLARALIGLGEPSAAARLLHHATSTATPGFPMELLTHAEEAAHDFKSAQHTARHLADLGTAAYPHGKALLATPSLGASFEGDSIDIPVISIGVERFEPFETILQPWEGGAGGVVNDVSYIPIYREDDGYVGTMASCPGWGWRRDAILANHAKEALVGLPKDLTFTDPRPNRRFPCGATGSFEDDSATRDLIRLEAGQEVDVRRPLLVDQIYDRRQNMWRWAGDLDRASDVIEDWLDAAPATADLPLLRLAEVRYLQGQYDASAATFGAAGRRIRQAQWNNDLGVDQADLSRATALIRAGRQQEGLLLLDRVATDAERNVARQQQQQHQQELGTGCYVADQFAAVAYHARTLLADTERETGGLATALESYEAAGDMLTVLEHANCPVTGHRPERLYANQAITELAAGRASEADTSIVRALHVDPMNPAFLMTAGFIADRRGHRDAAINYNRRALESDPGAFPAANDLGVQLAFEGRDNDAVATLRQAVHAKADYALAWFNLGVVYADMGPRHILVSQGAFARAIEFDPALANRKHELTIDTNIYQTGLDLSKPLPPRWSLAQLNRFAPATSAGLLALLLLAVGVARSTSNETREFASRWVETVPQALRKLPLVNRLRNRFRSPIWALGLTLVLFLATMIRQGWTEAWGLAVAGLAIATLAIAAIRSRILIAKLSNRTVRQKSWHPGMVLGIAATAAGAPWAPLPVISNDKSNTQAHAAAPLTLAVITGVLLLETVWLPVPLTKSMAITALIMAASTLLPVRPLDGARLGKTGLLAGAGLVGASTLIILGLG